MYRLLLTWLSLVKFTPATGLPRLPITPVMRRSALRHSRSHRSPLAPFLGWTHHAAIWPCHGNPGTVGWAETRYAQGRAPGWKERVGERRNAARVEVSRSIQPPGARPNSPGARCRKGERWNGRWRKAQSAQGNVQPLNPVLSCSTHYAQGRAQQRGEPEWGLAKDAEHPGRKFLDTRHLRERESNAVEPAAAPSVNGPVATALRSRASGPLFSGDRSVLNLRCRYSVFSIYAAG